MYAHKNKTNIVKQIVNLSKKLIELYNFYNNLQYSLFHFFFTEKVFNVKTKNNSCLSFTKAFNEY